MTDRDRSWEGLFLVDVGSHRTSRSYPRPSTSKPLDSHPSGRRVYEMADGRTITVDIAFGLIEFMGDVVAQARSSSANLRMPSRSYGVNGPGVQAYGIEGRSCSTRSAEEATRRQAEGRDGAARERRRPVIFEELFEQTELLPAGAPRRIMRPSCAEICRWVWRKSLQGRSMVLSLHKMLCPAERAGRPALDVPSLREVPHNPTFGRDAVCLSVPRRARGVVLP